jgi:histidinol-phosphate phosphatase family protein
VNPWKERAFVVASLESVDRVAILEEDRPLNMILAWKPDLYIKGGDYASSSLQSAAAVEAYGGKTVVIPPRFDASTTAMFERIQALAIHAVPQPAPNVAPRGLILLDRDGTLVRDACFDPLKIELLPGVIDALRMLQNAGFRLCIVSNQQGIGLGYYGYREFIDGNRRLLRMLGEAGITISKIYFCPHSEGDRCACRKPEPGMILRALREQDVPPGRCFMIGDSERDLEAARAAGCRGVIAQPGGIVEVARQIIETPY